ncbi:SGNH hydrolase superfamily [Synechococcus sp. PROS-7-1]|uniref:hypothetical protein n=1 Tax=Synechococcus sp. PROS-7-1 TaxID=1442556 RepID=UPI001644378C|nr:hypothetical protein [Synechococcus sp. PROS-7-1]QNI83923.1 SGNH hydrolase superfamily [Synechococcus sp. PROS-7-1]
MKNLYVVGNSHAHFFTFTHPGHFGWSPKFFISKEHDLKIQSCSIGPTTAYKFGIKHLPLLLTMLELNNVKHNDCLLIPVGEVDCRLHLPRQAHLQDKKIEVIVDNCLNRFFNVLMALKNLGYKPIAWGGHPSSDSTGDDRTYPRYADTQYRNYISQLWADGLKTRALNNNIYYASIFNELITQDLTPKPGIFQDGCHLSYSNSILHTALDAINDQIS